MIIKLFIILYIISVGFMYYIYSRNPNNPPLFPGDIYRARGTKKVYFPLGSSLIIAIILLIIFGLLRRRLVQ